MALMGIRLPRGGKDSAAYPGHTPPVEYEHRIAHELDALVTAVRELGQPAQTPTPFTDALLGLARVHARALGLYSQ